jgi:deoxyribodipyrimidine photo-lyase
VVESLGAAPKWRLGLGVEAFGGAAAAGSAFWCVGAGARRLRALIAETGAQEVHWNRLYDPAARARDEAVKSALKPMASRPGAMRGPCPVRALDGRDRDGRVLPRLHAVLEGGARARSGRAAVGAEAGRAGGLARERLSLPMGLGDAMNRGAAIVRPHLGIGEEAARGRLGAFIANGIADYEARDDLDRDGDLGPVGKPDLWRDFARARCWWAGMRAMEEGKPGPRPSSRKLVWRDFAYHLVSTTRRTSWSATGARNGTGSRGTPTRAPEVRDWKRGARAWVVDAAMREMYVTGGCTTARGCWSPPT